MHFSFPFHVCVCLFLYFQRQPKKRKNSKTQYLCVYFFWSNFLLVLMFVLQFYIVWNMHQSELNSSIDLRCGSHIINTQFTVIGANIMACRVCCRIHRNDWIILQLHMDIVIYICSGAELRSSTTATNHSGRSAMWTDGNNSRPCLATRAAGYNIWITNRSRSNTSGEIGIYAWRGTSKSVAFRSFFAHTKINKQKKTGYPMICFHLFCCCVGVLAGWWFTDGCVYGNSIYFITEIMAQDIRLVVSGVREGRNFDRILLWNETFSCSAAKQFV